jgi:hypothetical protein
MSRGRSSGVFTSPPENTRKRLLQPGNTMAISTLAVCTMTESENTNCHNLSTLLSAPKSGRITLTWHSQNRTG